MSSLVGVESRVGKSPLLGWALHSPWALNTSNRNPSKTELYKSFYTCSDRRWLSLLCSSTLRNSRQAGSVFRWKYLCFPCARFLETEYRYFLGTSILIDLGEQPYSMNTMCAPIVLKRALKNMPVNKTLMQASQAEYISRFYYSQHNAAAEFPQFHTYF